MNGPDDLGPGQPQDLLAERAVLGGLALSTDAIPDVADSLRAEDFYRYAHQTIYETILALYERKEPVDLVTIRAALGPKLDAVGGPAYLALLVDGVPRSANVWAYAKIIREHALRRRMMVAASRCIQDCAQAEQPASEVLATIDTALVGLQAGRIGDGLVPVARVLADAQDQINRNVASGGKLTGIPTGFPRLDAYTRGLQRGDFIVLGARPSVGKTALALNIAAYAATQALTVAFFSLEMSRNALGTRLMASEAAVNSNRLLVGDLDPGEWERVGTALATLNTVRLFVDDTSALTIPEIRSRARRVMNTQGLDLIIVDYLQLARTPGRVENRNQEVSLISRSLKALARDLNVPVLACSQLSRLVEQRGPDSRPRLSDLRDSGSLEQDADVVMLLWRADDNPSDASVDIAKQRNGPTGKIGLRFEQRFTRFRSVETL